MAKLRKFLDVLGSVVAIGLGIVVAAAIVLFYVGSWLVSRPV